MQAASNHMQQLKHPSPLGYAATEHAGAGSASSCPAATRAALRNAGYRLLNKLGEGASSFVYEAERMDTGERVAVKLLHTALTTASCLARFESEVAIGALTQSPYVARVLSDRVCTSGGQRFFTLELLRGRTLEAEARGPMAPRLVLQVLEQLAQALEHAHARGIVHCDIKPENVFVTEATAADISVKLLDFGIAKRHSANATVAPARASWLGTPLYMSPEQASGRQAEVDETTDTWALGLLAFRLLAGHPYFPAEHVQRMLLRIAFDPMQSPSEIGCHVSPAFDAWFMRSCSRERALRFRSPSAQVRALAAALAGVDRTRVEGRPDRPSLICDGHVTRASSDPSVRTWVLRTFAAVTSLAAMSCYAAWL